MQQFAAAECFAMSVPLDHRDGNGFHPFVGGEAKFAIETFPPASHTSSTIGGSGFEHPAIGVLARRALHARKFALLSELYVLRPPMTA